MNLSSVLETLFDVGVASIDQDHDGLLRAVEELRDQGHTAVDSEPLQDWIHRYRKQLAAHVGAEEELMLRIGVPATLRREHEADHKRIRRELTLLQEGRSKQGLQTAGDVYKFLKIELFKHFVRFDAKLAPYTTGAPTP